MKNTTMIKHMLLCDSGGTKADWVLLKNGKMISSFQTPGLNPVMKSEKALSQILKSEKRFQKFSIQTGELHFFGSGCGNSEGRDRMIRVLKKRFPRAKITVANDLMAAAISLCGNEKGIVAILGTGSNCCFYDGKKIHQKNFGLGYILGDEGSGTWFGKKFLQSYLYGTMPPTLAKKFFASTRLDLRKIIDAVYRKPGANLFLSSFMPFILRNRKHAFVKRFLENGIEEFLSSNVLSFPGAKKFKIHFTGSIAALLHNEIRKAGKKMKLKIGNVSAQPLEGLAAYYSD